MKASSTESSPFKFQPSQKSASSKQLPSLRIPPYKPTCLILFSSLCSTALPKLSYPFDPIQRTTRPLPHSSSLLLVVSSTSSPNESIPERDSRSSLKPTRSSEQRSFLLSSLELQIACEQREEGSKEGAGLEVRMRLSSRSTRPELLLLLLLPFEKALLTSRLPLIDMPPYSAIFASPPTSSLAPSLWDELNNSPFPPLSSNDSPFASLSTPPAPALATSPVSSPSNKLVEKDRLLKKKQRERLRKEGEVQKEREDELALDAGMKLR